RSAPPAASPATQSSSSSARRRFWAPILLRKRASGHPSRSMSSRRTTVCDLQGTRGNTGHCLEAHDLAASKLVAGREKDRVFVATLLQERLIDSGVLLERVARLPVGP